MRSLRLVLMVVAVAATLLQPAGAYAKEPPPNATATQPAISVPSEADLKEHGHYTNSQGNVVHSPAHSKSGAAPSGATAQCRDGSYSFSQHHRGTCSHHGGVAQWR
ncbi:hypothetical protein GALL_144310 [mine drainage metagenome]|uniref:DUF3761 domain-containing protein n=1 Tax=mine drainage metagenome TaxID=410659 RepID=A0A1J5SPJ3_9ZZZZ